MILPRVMTKAITVAVIVLQFLSHKEVYGSEGETKERSRSGSMVSQTDEIKKTIVFLGRSMKVDGEERSQFHATGFLISVQGIFHLLTAKHVVVDMKTGELRDGGLLAFFNSKDGRIEKRSIEEIKEHYKVDWIFHENVGVDIAMIPFGLDPQKDDVKVIPDDLFLSSDRLFELYDVFFLSYQPGIEPKGRISPVARGGMISIINDDRTFYVDAFAFPGNSGSPVFLKPSPIRFDEHGVSIGGDPLGGKFIGIIGAYLPYQEIAISTQTGRPRVIFEENTGLSKVWSVEFIREIFESESFKKQLDRNGGSKTVSRTLPYANLRYHF